MFVVFNTGYLINLRANHKLFYTWLEKWSLVSRWSATDGVDLPSYPPRPRHSSWRAHMIKVDQHGHVWWRCVWHYHATYTHNNAPPSSRYSCVIMTLHRQLTVHWGPHGGGTGRCVQLYCPTHASQHNMCT